MTRPDHPLPLKGHACHAPHSSSALAALALPGLLPQAARTQRYTVTDLGPTIIGESVNKSGQVAGYGSTTSLNTHAVLYSSGTLYDLGTLPGGSESYGKGINDSGQVTGYSYQSNTTYRAFLYSSGTGMADLGTLPGYVNSEGFGINSSGQVVGLAYSQNDYRAFLSGSSGLVDLNSRIPSGSGWTLQEASAISDNGCITGFGSVNGRQDGFLLTPQTGVSVASLSLSPTSVQGGAATSTGTITLTGPAPAGGVQITQTSSDTSAATLAPKLNIPAGATSAKFKITTYAVTAIKTVTITSTANGVSKTATLTVTP